MKLEVCLNTPMPLKPLAISLLTLAVVSCAATGRGYARAGEKNASGLPAFVQTQIDLDSAKLEPGSAVLKYSIAGQDYYELPTPCCDQLVPLYDSTGQLVCHPSGGFAGRGDGKCGTLFSRPVKAEVVWKKPGAAKPTSK